MKPNELDALIEDCLEGRLSEPDSAKLSALLEQSAEARARYWETASIHGLLEHTMQGASLRVVTGQALPTKPRLNRWLAWRPLAAAAAGLVLGIFGATAVWAMAAVKSPRVQEVPLADAGFEAGAPIPSGSVPQQPGQWSGDPCSIVEAQSRVHPREGRRMLKFLAASTTGDFPGSKNMATDLWQVIALPGSGTRTVRIRAWFNADTDKEARFQIAAVAGADASASAKELWEQRDSETMPLAFARTIIVADHDPATWEAGELTLQVPPQARVLVIGIAAYRLPVEPVHEWFPAQFLDDVSVSISEEVQP